MEKPKESIYDYLRSDRRPVDVIEATIKQLEYWDWLNASEFDESEYAWILRDLYIRNLMGYASFVGGDAQGGEFQFGPFFDLRWLNDGSGDVGQRCRQLFQEGSHEGALDFLIEDHERRGDRRFALDSSVWAVFGGDDLEFVAERARKVQEQESVRSLESLKRSMEREFLEFSKKVHDNSEAARRTVLKQIEQQAKDTTSVVSRELDRNANAAVEATKSLAASLHADFNKHKAELEGVKSAVKSSMELGAAHDHWNRRAYRHESKLDRLERRFRKYLALGGLVALVYVAIMLYFEPVELASANGFPNIGTILFVFSPILLGVWALRYAQHEYLEEKGLALEARSRATMAQTYVALLAASADKNSDKDFSDAQRLLILGTLFRPMDATSAVGDHSPPFGMEIISKAFSIGKPD